MRLTPSFRLIGPLVFTILATGFPAGPEAAQPPRWTGRPDQGSPGTSSVTGLGASAQARGTAWKNSQPNSCPSQPTKSAVNLSCSVVDWKTNSLKPVLTLACPGDEARVRVYLKLSWLDPHDRPENYQDIVASAGAATKLHSDPDGALVLLKFREAGKEKPRAIWISFNELVNLEVQGRD